MLYEDTMKRGYIESALALLILVGVTGSGKSLFKRLALGLSVPEFSPSTALAESAVRSMSICQVAVGGVEWVVVSPQHMMEMVAKAMKEQVPVLPSTWEESSHLAFTTLQRDSEKPQATMQDNSEIPQATLQDNSEIPQATVQEDSEVPQPHPVPPSQQAPVVKPKHNKMFAIMKTKCIIRSDHLNAIQIDSELLQAMTQSTLPDVQKLMDVNFIYMLDSGGQPPFREMLPHFVKRASGIVLMQKLNERLDFKPTIRYRGEGGKVDEGYTSQLTNEQILHQYLQGVQSHSSQVFVVGTYRDREGECDNETRETKNSKLLEAFQPILGEQLQLYKVGSPDQLIFPVDCTSRKTEDMKIAEEFRKRVMERCMGEKVRIPLPWFMLEQLLELLAKKMKVRILSINECCEAAQQKLLMPRNVCETAIRYLGELNIILYRPNILPNVVFPKAQIILDKITELVRCSHALRTEGEHSTDAVPLCMQSSEGLEFRDFGQISSKLLGKAFPSHYRDGLFDAAELLTLLKGLLIAARLSSGKHFIPSLLPDLPLEKVAEYRVASPEYPAPLVIHYSKHWLPVGVIPSLVAYLQNLRKWSISKKHSKPTCLYHNCMQFKLPNRKPGCVVLIDSTKFLEVHVKPKLKVDPNLLCSIAADITTGLEEAHKSLHYGPPETEMGFLCSGECGNEEVHLATVILDTEEEAWICSEDEDTGDILNQQQRHWHKALKDTTARGHYNYFIYTNILDSKLFISFRRHTWGYKERR